MGLAVCPTAIVQAPVEVLWDNVVQWERLARWADVRVERRAPEGPARRRPTFQLMPSTRHPVVSSTGETSSSHQVGGVGCSKNVAASSSPRASETLCNASSVLLKPSISAARQPIPVAHGAPDRTCRT